MIEFVIGLFAGILVSYIIVKQAVKRTQESPQPSQSPSAEHLAPPVQNRSVSETSIDIPIEILPNLYSLHISNISMKHHIQTKNGQKCFDYITFKFGFSYQLNGRKEGKRRLIVTSYDHNGGVIEVKGEYNPFSFTEAGVDVMEVCFNECNLSMPEKITIMVREGAKE